MKIQTIVISTTLLASGSFFAHNLYMDNQVKNQIDSFVNEINQKSNEKILIEDYGYNLSQKIYANNVKLVDQNGKILVNLGNVLINDIDLKNEIPRNFDISFSGLEYHIDNFEDFFKGEKEIYNIMNKISKNGIITTNANFSYNYSPENDNSVNLTFSENIQDVINVNMKISVDKLDLLSLNSNKEMIEKNPMNSLQSLAQVQIREVSFDVNDSKITQHFLEEIATKNSKFKNAKEAEDYAIKKLEEEKKRGNELSPEMASEISNLIRNKKGFSLSIKPEPMPVMSLFMTLQQTKSPNEAIDTLGISFKAK